MAYNTKNIKRDASGAPVPQFFDPAADDYQPLEGTGGAHKTQLTGSSLVEQQNEGHAVAGVHTFATNIYALEIFHNEIYSQPFWVNTLQLYVPPGGWRSNIGGTPGTTVTATALIGFEYTIGRAA